MNKISFWVDPYEAVVSFEDLDLSEFATEKEIEEAAVQHLQHICNHVIFGGYEVIR